MSESDCNDRTVDLCSTSLGSEGSAEQDSILEGVHLGGDDADQCRHMHMANALGQAGTPARIGHMTQHLLPSSQITGPMASN